MYLVLKRNRSVGYDMKTENLMDQVEPTKQQRVAGNIRSTLRFVCIINISLHGNVCFWTLYLTSTAWFNFFVCPWVVTIL